MRSEQNIILHLKYWIIILLGILILVACNNWTEKENFTDYLTNAATFVSLVLGIVAIVYSFVSNASLSSSLGNITKVSDEVTLTKNEISKFMDTSKSLNLSAQENAVMLHQISGEVENNISTLNSALSDINSKTQILQSVVEALPAQLDVIHLSIEQANAATAALSLAPAKVIKSAEYDVSAESEFQFHTRFIKDSSLSGAMFLHAVKTAYLNEISLNVYELVEKVGFSNYNYCYGYKVGCSAIQLFKSSEDAKTIKITEISPAFKDFDLKTESLARVKKVFDQESTQKEWTQKVIDIESYVLGLLDKPINP